MKIMEKSFPLTDEEYDALAQEFEAGTWEGAGEEVTLGRPKLFDEDMETVSFRLPLTRIHAVAAVTKRFGLTKSEFFRQAIDHELFALSANPA